MPDESTGTGQVRSLFKRPESVLVVVYTQQLDVLLICRQKPAGFWQSVTGSLEPGETPSQAAGRELALAARAGFDESTHLDWITGHGSERRFVRLTQGERRAVLMSTPPGDPEHERFLAVAAFL